MSWFSKFGWKQNPFTIFPNPIYMSGLQEVRDQVKGFVDSNDVCLITGVTGAGKTTLLKWLQDYGLPGYRTIYIDGLNYAGIRVDRLTRLGLAGKIFRRGRKTVLLVDECQNLSQEFSESIKAKWDLQEVFSIVFASIEEDLQNLTPSLQDRIGYRKVRLRPLNEQECLQLVQKRLEGQGNPFSDEALSYVFKQSDYQPRSILENLEKICLELGQGTVPKTIGVKHISKIIRPGGKKTQPEKQSRAEVLGYERPEEAFLKGISNQQGAIIRQMVAAGKSQSVKEIANALDKSVHNVYKQIGRLMLTADAETMKKKIPYAVIEKVSENPAKFDIVRDVKRLFARI